MTCLVNNGGWYPWVICHAVALVDDLQVFRSLPDSYSQVLRRLIKKVGRDDGQRAILARRQTIAEETGKSVETVYRALREFEARGWIEQRDRRPGERLIGSESEITFSRELCDLLDLPYIGKVKVKRSPPVSDDRSYKAIVVSYIQPSSKEQPSEFEDKNKNLSTTQNTARDTEVIRIEGKSVPKELAWLVIDRGLSLSGLFALMKLARTKGKTLSDVVACVKQHLGRLSGRDIFAYLSKLVTLDRDFAWEVRQKGERVKAADAKQDVNNKLQKAKARLEGKWFASKKSGAVFAVERGGWIRGFSLDCQGRIKEGSKLMEMAFVDAVEAGALVACEVGSIPILLS